MICKLTDFAVEFRYELVDEEPLDRQSVLAEVESLLNHVEKLVEKGEAEE